MRESFDNLFSIQGKTALITGGSRGIGEMIAAGFLSQGAKVYISSRKAKACEGTAERLSQSYGSRCIALPADLSNLQGVESLAAQLAAHETKLDVLVNNAGASWGAPLDEFPEMGWDKVMDTNVKGVFFLTQKLLPQLRAAGQGPSPARVINIGSIDGLKSSAFEAFSYGASKAAVHHLTRFMAKHLTNERILFNAIAPGPFPTWMLSTSVGFGGETEGVDWDLVGRSNPSGRVGTAQDIAGLAIFLSSRAGEYVVGQTIACDGGIVGTA
jgi:NAD(P)-dependent dehydrogenase (short-subunit alcohol dehydrogenase family)